MINRYKKIIDLVQFMKQEQYGLKETQISTPEKPMLERVADNNIKETYTVQRNQDNEFIYWSTKDNNLKGKSIIDFVQDNNKDSFKNDLKLADINKLLEPYALDNRFIAHENCSIKKCNDKNLTIAKELKGLAPVHDRTVLYNKGISDETIDNPLFKNIIHNIPGKDPMDIGFVMINENGFEAIDIRSLTINDSIGEKENAIICSKLETDPPITTLVVAQTMEEAMAHYELNYNSIQAEKNHIRYIATGGEPTMEQLRLIQKNIDILNPSTLAIASGNSITGEYQHCKIISSLNLSPEGKSLYAKSLDFRGHIEVENNQKNGFMKVTLSKDSPSFQENYNKLMSAIEDKQKTFQNVFNQGKPFSVEVDEKGKNDCVVNIGFQNTKNNWLITSELIHEVKLNNHPFLRKDSSMYQDFTMDLKEFKEEKTNTKENNNDLSIGF
ncbi:MAG: hypothetical protein HS119_11540 [Flavobacteriales bacterium]|nr:hypothetical protein [Flavobacteriales bacterium]